ncbi:MAG: hypothetical protein JWP36_2732 [Paucimonas sp.]|nr:hypothetical protein [Paucimonas sp.]
MQNTVIGVYDNYSQAQSAFNELVARGFTRSNVNLSPSAESTEARGAILKDTTEQDQGWSIGHFFRSLFGSEDESATHRDVYQEAVRRGSYLVTVEADSDEQRDQATDILNRFDPVDIDERSSQWRTQGWSGYDRNAPLLSADEIQRERASYQGSASTTTGKTTTSKTAATRAKAGTNDMTGGTLEGEARLKVVEEEMQVGKRVVQRGGVRIYQRMTERPVEETVHLREENVQVQRRPVDKPATEADMAAFKEGSMELRETAEEPVVSKTARVVEEVVVGKQVSEHDEKIKGTVRRTDVEVEQLGAGNRATPGGTVDFDRDYYRNHWQTSFASQGGRYEDYEPAYRFGSELRGNQAYRGRNWNEIEPEARRDWESRHSGSAWERAKDAVRHAWERATT